MKASIVSVLRICTHILYTSHEIEASYLVYTTGGIMNLVRICHNCARLMAPCPYQFHLRPSHGTAYLRQQPNRTDGINLATPGYQLTVSPSAAPKQHPRQDQVINRTRYLHMGRNCATCSGCLSECKNSCQCHSVIHGFYF